MNADAPARRSWSVRPVSLAILALVSVFLGYLSGFPDGAGLYLALAAVVMAGAFRSAPEGRLEGYAPVPVLVVLVLEAITAPAGFGTELIAGLSALSFLVWLADDPARPAGAVVRALPEVALPALALGIAWSSALVLPSGVVPLGVAGALLAVAVAAVAFLLGWPSALDREEARS